MACTVANILVAGGLTAVQEATTGMMVIVVAAITVKRREKIEIKQNPFVLVTLTLEEIKLGWKNQCVFGRTGGIGA